MFVAMSPATFIRRHVFRCETQAAFAELIGVTQATVSRWESEGRISRSGQDRIRAKAAELAIKWMDGWFFSAPPEPANDPAPTPAPASETAA